MFDGRRFVGGATSVLSFNGLHTDFNLGNGMGGGFINGCAIRNTCKDGHCGNSANFLLDGVPGPCLV